MVVKHVTDQLLAAVDALAPEFIELLGQSVQAQSVTGYEEPVVQLYEQALRSFGWMVETQPLADSRLREGEKRVGKRANVVATFGGRDAGLLVLNGHLDVVPPGTQRTGRSPRFQAAWSMAGFTVGDRSI
ncbi:hypothetical protein [Microbacterium sp. NIBRBAC000506063]|uniref:hypothetical protein n=1 Tax=Microbacterium sp. NIBRBAC000506063 TaxID=2734618 RepID=UPI001CB71DBD|nr:hypothetical protein [Microbacterium sp. NIBRBAC000506063]